MKYLFLISCLLISSLSIGQGRLTPPMPDNTLVEFLDDLEEAVDRKDKQFILDRLSENIQVSFGDDAGIASFHQYWDLDNPGSSFWRVMKHLLKLGGGVYDGSGSYAIPYVFTDWPDEAYDPFEYLAVTGSNVNVRDQANTTSSKVVGQFNYDIVQADYEKCVSPPEGQSSVSGYQWYYLKLPDGSLEGYVYGDFVWSPLSYRSGFVKVDKKWTITFLIAGD